LTDQAFSLQADPEQPHLALDLRLLVPEGYGQILSGGQRIVDYDELNDRVRDRQLPEETFRWYLDLRRHGSVPHAGFSMGIERVVAWLCGLDHVRDAIPFPHMLYRFYL
jgi:asparaginyl-tRNA synthetase